MKMMIRMRKRMMIRERERERLFEFEVSSIIQYFSSQKSNCTENKRD